MLDILYYPEGNRGPARDYLTQLARERPKAFARLALDLEVLGAEDDLELAHKRLKEVMAR